jgi:TatD DNase family protein
MGLFDVHAHLTHPRFAGDVDAVLERARAAGLTRIISNGLNHEDNLEVQALAARSDLVRPAYGLYPVDAVLPRMLADGIDYPRAASPTSARDTIDWIEAHADEAIAIGEVGLDGKWVPEQYWDEQDEVFGELVRLAIAVDKPLIVHTRSRELECLEILMDLGARRVDFHCFSARVKLAKKVASAGYSLSIPANARKAQNFTLLLRKIPRELLLLETDAPYLSPDREGLPRNEPSSVSVTLDLAAELWGETRESALEIFEDNYRRLFREDP